MQTSSEQLALFHEAWCLVERDAWCLVVQNFPKSQIFVENPGGQLRSSTQARHAGR